VGRLLSSRAGLKLDHRGAADCAPTVLDLGRGLAPLDFESGPAGAEGDPRLHFDVGGYAGDGAAGEIPFTIILSIQVAIVETIPVALPRAVRPARWM
jgi:hypothetical protein